MSETFPRTPSQWLTKVRSLFTQNPAYPCRRQTVLLGVGAVALGCASRDFALADACLVVAKSIQAGAQDNEILAELDFALTLALESAAEASPVLTETGGRDA